MTGTSSPDPHPFHLAHLAADADDVVAMLTRHHEDGGDIHPEALPKAERLATSLRQLITALGTHEPLAASTDDVLHMLGIEPGHESSSAER